MSVFSIILVLNLSVIFLYGFRSKRFVLFPKPTVLQLTYGIAVPLALPNRTISLNTCLQVNYDLPNEVSQLKPKIVKTRSIQNPDISREDFYEYFIAFFDNTGFDGLECLLRLICDVAQIPFYTEGKYGSNLLEHIAHYVFTPSIEWTHNNTTSRDTDLLKLSLLEAEQFGKSGLNCTEEYYDCNYSIIDTFTKYFSV